MRARSACTRARAQLPPLWITKNYRVHCSYNSPRPFLKRKHNADYATRQANPTERQPHATRRGRMTLPRPRARRRSAPVRAARAARPPSHGCQLRSSCSLGRHDRSQRRCHAAARSADCEPACGIHRITKHAVPHLEREFQLLVDRVRARRILDNLRIGSRCSGRHLFGAAAAGSR